MKKILLFSRDPAGANIIVSMYPILKQEYDIYLYGKDTALHVYDKYQLTHSNIDKLVTSFTPENIYNFLSSQQFDGLVTSTSAEDFTERLLWQAAKKLNIYHVAILDQWMNYSLRFLKFHENYQVKKKYSLNEYILPQNIFVMDEHAKRSMIKEGIPNEFIKVTGQPYFEHFINQHKKPTSYNRNTEKLTWLFASEPITTVYGKEKGLDIYGYTEQTILYSICNIISQIQYKSIDLKIKRHPRDNSDVYREICNQFPFVSLTSTSTVEAILKSDAVLGMSSTLLLEAALLNKPILSIQLNLKIKSPFILDQIDKSKSILNENNLKKELILLTENKSGSTDSKLIADLPVNNSAIRDIFLYIKKGLNP